MTLGRQFLCAFALLSAAGRPALAESLSLSPAVVQLRGKPGQSTTQTLTLQNNTRMELEFELEAKDVVVHEGQRAFVPAGQLRHGIAATAVFSPTHVRVAPGQSSTATVTVTLPEGAEPRAVVALFRGTTAIATGKTTQTASLGTLLTFTLSDQISISPSQLQVSPPSPSANAAFEETLANDGHEPVVATGMAVVLDASGALIGKSPFEPHRLLPGEQVRFRAEYAGELKVGQYRVVSTFQFEDRALTQSAILDVR